jgi:hypothetical protein
LTSKKPIEGKSSVSESRPVPLDDYAPPPRPMDDDAVPVRVLGVRPVSRNP